MTSKPSRSKAAISLRMKVWLTLGYWLMRYAIVFLLMKFPRVFGVIRRRRIAAEGWSQPRSVRLFLLVGIIGMRPCPSTSRRTASALIKPAFPGWPNNPGYDWP